MRISAVLFAAVLLSAQLAAAAEDIRPARVAGLFYEKDPARLAAQVDLCLANAKPAARPAGEVRAIIVPHAGHVYSGTTAAYAYALVKGMPFETVVVIGPSHHAAFTGCSIYAGAGFATPLGVVPVDQALARALTRASGFDYVPEAYDNPGAEVQEHSVEVQVPFIQRALPGAKIVPVVMGLQTRRTIQTMAAALTKACAAKKVLVVASTDLSHFLPKAEAAAVDAGTIALVREAKTETLIRKVEAGENIMCGGGPVVAALLYARKLGPARVEVLRRADSSEAGGPDSSVVGYLAAAVLSEKADAAPEDALSAEDKAQLLRLARSAVTEFVGRGALLEDRTANPKLLEPRGVFVTLKKRGELRGCIGFIDAVAPLGQAVIRAAVYAATEDPRFPAVAPDEVPGLEFEISVLTPPREVASPELVRVGRHGLIVTRGGQKGVLLPQVPVENGWDRETFLEQGCLKAGLPPDAWKKGAKLEVFEAVVFHEQK
ncbi:MAG TPA: AmmeMemoRadiSam system protein B [Terriglobales bacterium]|nr:AmmeMemoRadiSam system protein B [Terriglobales bacterium]